MPGTGNAGPIALPTLSRSVDPINGPPPVSTGGMPSPPTANNPYLPAGLGNPAYTGGLVTGPYTGPGTTGTGNVTTPTGTGSIPSSASDIFRYLIQQAMSRGPVMPGNMNTGGMYDYLYNQIGNNANQRDSLINMFMSGNGGGNNLLSTLQGMYDRGNQGDPFSPAAMTALRNEATTGLADRYNNAAGNIRTSLMQRGMGGGQLPANGGQMMASYGPLQSSLAQAQSSAGSNATMANEQQILQSLMQNRQLAGQAVGMGNSLMNTVGNIYNPQPYITNALNTMGTQIGAYNAGTQAFGPATSAANGYGNMQPTSFRSILLSSLLGAGGKLLSDPSVFNSIIKVLGNVFGGGNNTPLWQGPMQSGSDPFSDPFGGGFGGSGGDFGITYGDDPFGNNNSGINWSWSPSNGGGDSSDYWRMMMG